MHPFRADVHERLLIIGWFRRCAESDSDAIWKEKTIELSVGNRWLCSMQRAEFTVKVGVYDEWITREDIGKG